MWRGRLTVKLPLLVVAAVLLTASAAACLAVYVSREVLRRQALVDVVERREIYANAIEFYLKGAVSLIAISAERPRVVEFASQWLGSPGRAAPPAVVERFREIFGGVVLRNSEVFEYLMLLRSNGDVYLLEPRGLERELSHRSMSFAAWFKDVVRTSGLVVSDLNISPATQRPGVVIAAPIRGRDGQVLGILAGELKLDELSKIGSISLSGGGTRPYGYLTDRRGLVIAHQAKPTLVENQTDFSSVPSVRAALVGTDSAGEYVNPVDHEAKLGAYRPLPRFGWAVVYSVPVHVALGPAKQLTWWIVVGSAGLSVMLGLGAVFVARRVAGPIGHLTSAAESIGIGTFRGQLDIRTGDEIEVLATAFNRMAVTLRETEGKLRGRAEELEEVNQALESFSYSVSHDLRAPLRAMDGFTRILLEEDAGVLSARGQRFLGLVRENAGQMGRLIDDLLDFSRLGRQPIRKQVVDQEALVREVLEDLESERNGRPVEIAVLGLYASDGDPALLKQIWTNLLANALKFTRDREDARISVGSDKVGRETVYFVRDNGVGFDMRYADKVFGVFQRLHRAEDYPGTGVGLAIVQRIVQRHGGRVWAEAAEGKGATFYFTMSEGPEDGRRRGGDLAGRGQPE
jgi:signal transduction histidine kinase